MKIHLAFPALAILCISSGISRADSINSVSCSTPGAALVTAASSCSAADYGFANATSTSTVTLPSSVGQAAEIDSSASVSALLGGSRGISAFSTAQSSTSVSIEFDTAGPVRNGFLALSFLQTEWAAPTFGNISEVLSIGNYIASPNGQNLSVFIPIQLGTDFSFSYQDTLVSNGDAATGIDSAAIGSDISLLAFEADQTTAVNLFDPPSSVVATPEPASFGLMAAATLAGVGLIRKSRRQR
jgi:hypothetical protein